MCTEHDDVAGGGVGGVRKVVVLKVEKSLKAGDGFRRERKKLASIQGEMGEVWAENSNFPKVNFISVDELIFSFLSLDGGG